MGIAERLKEERVRLGFSQVDFAEIAGAHRKSQGNYESGERLPDAAYLAAIATAGADIHYIVTGNRDAPPPEVVAPDERYLLERYRGSPQPLKDAALRVLLGGEPSPPKGNKQVNAKGGVAQQFNGPVGTVAPGDIVNKGKRKG